MNFLFSLFAFLYTGSDLLFYLKSFSSEKKAIAATLFACSCVVAGAAFYGGTVRAFPAAAAYALQLLVSLLLFRESFGNKFAVFAALRVFDVSEIAALIIDFNILLRGRASAGMYLVMLGAKLICCLYFSYVYNKVKTLELSRKSLIFLLMPTTQHLLAIIPFLFLRGNGMSQSMELPTERLWFRCVLSLGIFLIFVAFYAADVFSFRGFINNYDLADIKAQIKMLEYQSDINNKYYNDVKNKSVEMHKIRHDFNNILQSIYMILSMPDAQSDQTAERMLAELREQVEAIHISSYCENSLVNAILSAKEAECREKQLDFSAEIHFSASSVIEDFDLCRCLCGILDAALQYAESLKNTNFCGIRIFLTEKDGVLTIAAGCDVPGAFGSDQKSRRKKEPPQDYILGIALVRAIAEKYCGFVEGDFGGESHTVTVCLGRGGEQCK